MKCGGALFGAFLCTKEALPAIVEQRYGRIINVQARLATMGAPSLLGRRVGGVEGRARVPLTKATAIQGAPHGITCNSVAPYAVNAGMALTAPVSKDSVVERSPSGDPDSG